MGCSGCSPQGCGDKGHCSTGSCNKMNTYDWINALDLEDPSGFQYIEVSFKGGARKEFYYNEPYNQCNTGDAVVVEAQAGYDIGTITLSGEMVRMQMKRKHTNEDRVLFKVIRRANERDLEKLEEARKLEYESLVRARAISQTLGLDMKLGDVEYQGDLKKATFFYTANGRVDFRELVRAYAKEFRVKIEMRQIGSRQESARIGGIGSCGRELCCSTWLSDFRSVNTSAARYQNIAINQTKLSGQCGRLKCCLNYELDTYMDAVRHFPDRADYIMTKKGRASLMKTDIFKGLMFYSYDDITMRGVFHPLDKERVKEILAMNRKGIHPDDLTSFVEVKQAEVEVGYADVTGEIELPNEKRRKKKPRGRKTDRRSDHDASNTQKGESQRKDPSQEKSGREQPRSEKGAENQNSNHPRKTQQGQRGPKRNSRDNHPQERPKGDQAQGSPSNQDGKRQPTGNTKSDGSNEQMPSSDAVNQSSDKKPFKKKRFRPRPKNKPDNTKNNQNPPTH